MKRLLKDAQKLSGQKYNIKNLNDIIEAIHVIQQELDITGTTEKEAAETISGSWNSTKAAWNDLLAGLSSGNADIDALTANLGNSVLNTTRNVAKAAGNLVVNTGRVFKSVFTLAGNAISDGWQNTVWPWIQQNFKATLGIELPDWATIANTISTKWEEIKASFADGFNLSIQMLVSDFNTVKGEIEKGWNGIVEWWYSVKRTLGIGVEVKSSVHTSSDGTQYGGGGGYFSVPRVPGAYMQKASGLRRVPYDGLKARLHKNEAVLTASQAAIWRGERMPAFAGATAAPVQTDQPINLTVNINGNTKTPYETAQEIRNALDLMRWQA